MNEQRRGAPAALLSPAFCALLGLPSCLLSWALRTAFPGHASLHLQPWGWPVPGHMLKAPSCLQGPDALGAWTLVSAGAVEDKARRGKRAALSGLRCLWGQGGRTSRLPQPGLMLFPFTQLSQSRQGKPPLKQPACSSSEVHRPVRDAVGGKSAWRVPKAPSPGGDSARPSWSEARSPAGCRGRGGGGQDSGGVCGRQHWPGWGQRQERPRRDCLGSHMFSPHVDAYPIPAFLDHGPDCGASSSSQSVCISFSGGSGEATSRPCEDLGSSKEK